jgi:hypothetical protein
VRNRSTFKILFFSLKRQLLLSLTFKSDIKNFKKFKWQMIRMGLMILVPRIFGTCLELGIKTKLFQFLKNVDKVKLKLSGSKCKSVESANEV